MRLFDALMYLGCGSGVEPFLNADLPTLRKTLDRYGIEKALVSSFAAKHADIEYGNALMFEAASEEPRLIPCPVVIPNSGLEIGDERAHIQRLVEQGARAVCVYPKTHNFKLDPRISGNLFTALEAHRLPVSLRKTEVPEGADLAAAYPGLPVILHAPSYRTRNLLPLLKANPNLHIALTPNFAPYRGLEVFAEHCGAEHFLFASSYPVCEPGAPLAYMLYSALEQDTVDRIAFGNTQRLVDAVRIDPATEPKPAPATLPSESKEATDQAKEWGGLRANAWQRQPLPLKGIVDVHAHYGRGTGWPQWGGDADDLVEEMDRVGVEKMMVSHNVVVTSSEPRWGNDEVLKAMERYPERILGYAICCPKTEQTGLTEIRRAVDAGMSGIKLHLSAGTPYDSDLYEPVWAFAAERKLPVLLHTWGDKIEGMEPTLSRWNDIPILLGHAGSGNLEGYVKVARNCPHVFLETCFSASPYGVVEYFVKELGAERIVWGSDAPWMSIGHQIGRVLFADISDADKETILVHNPHRILVGS